MEAELPIRECWRNLYGSSLWVVTMPKRSKAKNANRVKGTGASSIDYWEQSVQPLNCLFFIVPLLLLYEVGVVWLGPAAMRNGADVWLRKFLASLGLGEYVFLPLVTCGFLLARHHISRNQWKLRSDVLSGMVCESFGFGVVVLLVAQTFAYLFPAIFGTDSTTSVESVEAAIHLPDAIASIPRMLSFLGAGIYEELLFRLILLSGTISFCRRIGADRFSSVGFAVLSTSLLFASAHYKLFFAVGLDFTWYSFTFRMLAGVVFCILFLRRGFGIVVGTHAVYDILVATISA